MKLPPLEFKSGYVPDLQTHFNLGVPRGRAYSNVQPDTKCVVGKEICAVKNQILCSYFLRPNCINQFCRESVKFRDNSPGFIAPPAAVREKFCLENCCYYPPSKILGKLSLLPPPRKFLVTTPLENSWKILVTTPPRESEKILGKHPILFSPPPRLSTFQGE